MSQKQIQGRRDFLSRTALTGAAVVLGPALLPLDGLARVADKALPASMRTGLAAAQAETFASLSGEAFQIRGANGSLGRNSRLIQVQSRIASPEAPGRRRPFSIVFNVPGTTGLEQGQYSISHPRIGTMNLFMVPVDLPGVDSKLQAIFG